MADKKKFGLVMPKKTDALKIKKCSVFDNDSDEDEKVHKRPKILQKKIESKRNLKTDSVEDPSIYEYDDIYEEMKQKQAETIAPKEKSSRYIETLLKAAEKRKKEYERRIDKKIQAERDKEGDKYKDKEAFVTSSYKKKMLEQEEEEQNERRENMLNDMMDVTKQNDLSGFYRHFLKQTVGEENVPKFGERQIKEEIVNDEDLSFNREDFKNCENIDQDSDNVEINDEHPKSHRKSHTGNQRVFSDGKCQHMEQFCDNDKSKTVQFQKHSRKHYRKSLKNSNLSSSSTENEEDDLQTEESFCSGKKSNKNNSESLPNSRDDSHSSPDNNSQLNENSDDTGTDCNRNQKLNIFAKRTIGNIFINAQARYFQRIA